MRDYKKDIDLRDTRNHREPEPKRDGMRDLLALIVAMIVLVAVVSCCARVGLAHQEAAQSVAKGWM
jgi:hypothetical protein